MVVRSVNGSSEAQKVDVTFLMKAFTGTCLTIVKTFRRGLSRTKKSTASRYELSVNTYIPSTSVKCGNSPPADIESIFLAMG